MSSVIAESVKDHCAEVHVHSVTHGQLRKPQHKYARPAVRKSHFKLNRVFRAIRDHPYWCQQKSRTGCCRNTQHCPPYFWN